MMILAVDSSAVSAGAAIVNDGKILSEGFVNNKLTHSRTLMPLIKGVLENADVTFDQIDAIAVNAGPGSFTGIRIGVACVKGLAFSADKPCVGVSTLESIAYNVSADEKIVCSVMDARCNQVYNGLFRVSGGKVVRLCEDRAISVDDLKTELSGLSEDIIIAGDGALLVYENVKEYKNISLAPEKLRYQQAYGVAACAEPLLKAGKGVSQGCIMPVYLRMSQAERELKKKGSV